MLIDAIADVGIVCILTFILCYVIYSIADRNYIQLVKGKKVYYGSVQVIVTLGFIILVFGVVLYLLVTQIWWKLALTEMGFIGFSIRSFPYMQVSRFTDLVIAMFNLYAPVKARSVTKHLINRDPQRPTYYQYVVLGEDDFEYVVTLDPARMQANILGVSDKEIPLINISYP